MARLTFPNAEDRLVYTIEGASDFRPAVARLLRVYTDSGATTLADIQTLASAAIVNSELTVDGNSLLPEFKGPDGFDTLYVKPVGGSTVTRITANTDARLDAQDARIDGIVTGTGFVENLNTSLNVTVGSGGDFATIGAALLALSKKYPNYVKNGLSATVTLLSGFVMAEQVAVERIDLGWITITSVDAEVTITRSALSVKQDRWYSAWRVSDGAVSPFIDVLFNMNATGTATERVGFYVRNASTISFGVGAGCKNAGERGMDLTSASCAFAGDTIWSGAGAIGFRCSNGSTVQLTQSTITGCGSLTPGVGVNVSVGGSCSANLTQCILTDANGDGINVSGNSMVNADSCDTSRAAASGLRARAGTIQFTESTAADCGQYAISATGASIVHCGREGATFNAFNGTGCDLGGLLAEQGAVINAEGANLNNCGGSGAKATHGATIVMNSATAIGSAGIGISADHGSFIDANLVTATGAGSWGMFAGKGSRINAQLANVSGALGTRGIRAENGSIINAQSANAQRGGAADPNDIDVVTGSMIMAHGATGGISRVANSITTNGIIFQ